MDTASEGGAWGIALLAAYFVDKMPNEKLEEYLENRIFKKLSGETIEAAPDEVAGFETFMKRYEAGLALEKAAIDIMNW